MSLDGPTREILSELKQTAQEQFKALARASAKTEEQELEDTTTLNEDEIRPVIFQQELRQPQYLYLSKSQTEDYFAATTTLMLAKVQLRERILKPGEIIFLLVELFKDDRYVELQYPAEVISADLCPNTKPKHGITNLIVKKL